MVDLTDGQMPATDREAATRISGPRLGQRVCLWPTL